MTAAEYAAMNAANVIRFAPEMAAAQADRDAHWDAQRSKMLAKYGPAAVARGYNTEAEYHAVRKREGRADFFRQVLLPIAASVTGGAALAAAGPGAAAAAGGGFVRDAVASTAAQALGAGGAMSGTASAAGVPWLRLAEIGTPLVTGFLGSRAANQANARALDAEMAANQRAEARLDANEVRRRHEWDAAQELAREAFAAEQEQLRLDRAAADEERAHNRAVWDAREQRRTPYRQAGQAALVSLANLAGVPVSAPASEPRPMPEGWAPAAGSRDMARPVAIRETVAPSRVRRLVPTLVPLSQVGW